MVRRETWPPARSPRPMRERSRSSAIGRSLDQEVDLGPDPRKSARPGELPQDLRGHEMWDDPVGLPQADEPEEAAVRVAIEARARTVRTGDREADLADPADTSARGGKNKFVGNGFAGRCGNDAVGIQGSPELPRPSRGSRAGRSRARGGPRDEGGIPSLQDPPVGRSAVGLKGTGSGRCAGKGLRTEPLSKKRATGASGRASAHRGRPRRSPRASRRRRSLGGWDSHRGAERPDPRSVGLLGGAAGSGILVGRVWAWRSPRVGDSAERGEGPGRRHATPHGNEPTEGALHHLGASVNER